LRGAAPLFALILLLAGCAGGRLPERQVWEGIAIPSPEELSSLAWSRGRIEKWYASREWPVGANFLPSTAINMIEMFREEDFDRATIDRELGWAADTGMNCMRVFLPYLLWKEDREAFLDRFDRYMAIAWSHGIGTIPVLFDSVWDPYPEAGPQREPVPGVHNSGWVQSPGIDALMDREEYPLLEEYVRRVTGRFAHDERILFWDLYNEPDNGNIPLYHRREPRFKTPQVYRLLSLTWLWARESRTEQPLTAGVWTGDWSPDSTDPFVRLQLDASDLISFHVYSDAVKTERRLVQLQEYGRPLVCTEYMARPMGSTFQDILPLFRDNRVGAVSWGLVSGRSQTIYPWDSWEKPYPTEPDPWFHDIFYPDGTPYNREETDLIKKLTGR